MNGQPWELRYRRTFFILGTVEICGPAGCEKGVGVNLAT